MKTGDILRARLADADPEDLGLPPLNCGSCGAEAIGSHPCPECGWTPRPSEGVR